MKNMIMGIIVFFSVVFNTFAASYYVDATAGSDSNNGISEQTPWKTLGKVNTATLSSGDSVLFKLKIK